MPAGMSEEEYDDIEALMGAESGIPTATLATGGRGYGLAGGATHYRPGHTGVGYPGMPVSPSEVEEMLPGVTGSEAMAIGQEKMANRRPATGHRGDTAHHPGRRVDRQSFGL